MEKDFEEISLTTDVKTTLSNNITSGYHKISLTEESGSEMILNDKNITNALYFVPNKRPINAVRVKIINKSSNPLPEYETIGSAGFDLASNEDTTLFPGDTKLIGTGLFVEIPQGFELQIRSRSGLSINNQIIVLNSPGCVDSDFRGEVKVILTNLGCKKFEIKTGDRIAQGVISLAFQAEFKIVDKLSETERGSGGFGSTGIETK